MNEALIALGAARAQISELKTRLENRDEEGLLEGEYKLTDEACKELHGRYIYMLASMNAANTMQVLAKQASDSYGEAVGLALNELGFPKDAHYDLDFKLGIVTELVLEPEPEPEPIDGWTVDA